MSRPLTTRENQILEIIAFGSTNGEAAMVLGITEKTVKNNLLSVFTKLNVRNRVEATLRFHGIPFGGERLMTKTPESAAFEKKMDDLYDNMVKD